MYVVVPMYVVLCALRDRCLSLSVLDSTRSEQFEPSSAEYDTGLDGDDEATSMRLVVWGCNISTHVLPVAVVSLRLLPPTFPDLASIVDGIDPSANASTSAAPTTALVAAVPAKTTTAHAGGWSTLWDEDDE
jgi:hypothetical protein